VIDSHTFDKDADFHGAKGLILIGDKLVLYRRDHKTDQFPGKVDVPGGGRMPGESPFETFQRESREEFSLSVSVEDVIYSRCYPRPMHPGQMGYFLVVRLADDRLSQVKLGDEGEEVLLMTAAEYLNRKDAWPVFQERAKHFFETEGVKP